MSQTGLGAFSLAKATADHLPSPDCDGSTGALLTKGSQQLADSPVGHFIEGLDPVFSPSHLLT